MIKQSYWQTVKTDKVFMGGLKDLTATMGHNAI